MNDTSVLLPHLKLQLDIDHPSYEESYSFGYECAVSEMGEEENPYAIGTQEHKQWLEGWWAGFYGEEPLFKLPADSLIDNPSISDVDAANDHAYHFDYSSFLTQFFKITSAITATAVLGYQIFELVA